MATTENLHTGDASKTKFSFTFPYLNQTDVEVYKYVTNAWVKQTITTHYTFDNATTIKFGSAPAAATSPEQALLGDAKNIKIKRNTSGDALAATFYPGSAIRAGDLNDNYTQNLYVTQEASNAVTSANTDAAAAVVTADQAKQIATDADTIADEALANSRESDGSGGYNTAISIAKTAKTKSEDAEEAADDATAAAAAAFQRDGSAKMTGDIVFDPDGATHETTLTVQAPSGSNKTVKLPNATGTVPVLAVHSDTAITATPAELNILDGVTADKDELNILDGVTADKDELNKLDGATVSTDQLNYVTGVTSSIQTQLGNKQASSARLTTLADMPSATASILVGSPDLTSTTTKLNLLADKSIVTSITGSADDTQIPTAEAVNEHVVSVINDVGGFVPIANIESFPETNPDPGDNAGTIVSIADAGGLVVNGSGVSTTGDTITSDTEVTINGIDSSLHNTTIAAGKGMLVQTTSTEHTYTYHRLVVDEAGVASAQTLVTDFNQRYQVASSAPSNQPDGTALAEGDLFFNTGTNKMMVYDGSDYAVVTSVGDYKLLTVVPDGETSGTPDYTNVSFDLRDGSSAANITSVGQLLVSVNGVIQKPNSTSWSASNEGFHLEGTNGIKFCTAPGAGASVYVTLIGSATTVNVPANNSVATDKIENLAVTEGKIATGAVATAKIADDAVTADKLANSINTEIAANTAKVSNATHTGDVTGATELTIAANAVETGMIADDAVTTDKLANAINTDIAAKAPKANPTFTGTVTAASVSTDGQYIQQEETLTVSSNATTVDCSTGNYFTVTASGNITFTFGTVPADTKSYAMVIEVNHDSGTLTWPAAV